jgi:histidinol-phosphate aminotransferase
VRHEPGKPNAVYAHALDVSPAERLATGTGSVALLQHLMQAVADPGADIVYSWRSFEAYPITATVAGLRSVRVPNTPEHGHDLAAMAKAIGPETRAVIVCNPNNPTGTWVGTDELDEFVDAVDESVLVVIDEAYREFVADGTAPDALERYGDRPNTVVLRTFSKAWGLAGLRVGYLIAAPDIAATIRKCVTPFAVNSLAQTAALAALDAADEMRRRAALVVAERGRVLEAVRRRVPDTPDTQANFVWLPLGERSVDFAVHCERQGILVRPFAGDGVRASFGLPDENERLLEAVETFTF